MPLATAQIHVHALEDEDPTSALMRSLTDAADHRWPPPSPPPGGDVPTVAWYRLAHREWIRAWRASTALEAARARGWWLAGAGLAVGLAVGALAASAC